MTKHLDEGEAIDQMINTRKRKAPQGDLFNDHNSEHKKTVGIIGARQFYNYNMLKKVCKDVFKERFTPDFIISGGFRSIDSMVNDLSKELFIRTKKHKSNWKVGINKESIKKIEVVRSSDMLIVFWDGQDDEIKLAIDEAINRGILLEMYMI